MRARTKVIPEVSPLFDNNTKTTKNDQECGKLRPTVADREQAET